MSDNAQIGKIRTRSPWSNRTTVRWLHGIEYEIFEFPDDIYDYVNTEVKRELETDLLGMGGDPRADNTVDSLSKRNWTLEIVGVRDICLNPSIVNSFDSKTGRKFTERLVERRSKLREALDAGRATLWPLVAIGDERLLVDGYCRHSALNEMMIPETYCYVGRFVGK